jgi:hypothetical protein
VVTDADVPLPVIPIVTALEAACRVATCAGTAGVKIKMIGASTYQRDPIVSVLVDSPTEVVALAEVIGMDVYRLREQPSGPGEGRLGTTVCQLDYVPPTDPDAHIDPEPDGSKPLAPGVRISIAAFGTADSVRKRRTTVVRKGQPPHQER